MGLKRFIGKSNKNNYTNLDVVVSNTRSSNLRGKSADLIIVDDLAFIDDITNRRLSILDPTNKK